MANRSFASGLNPQSIFTNRARRQDVASRRRRLLGRAARAAHSAAMEALEQRQLLSGVLGSYYDNMDLSGFVVQRSDANINFNWGSDVPVAGIGADTFSVRWLGTITTPANETGNTYTFKTTTDDGVRLWVDNMATPLINKWQDQNSSWTATVNLNAGSSYELRMEYYDNGWGAQAMLEWDTPSTSSAMTAVPTAALTPPSIPGTGSGLVGTYYNNKDLTSQIAQRTDGPINFNWGQGSPIAGVDSDTFSVHWQGNVQAIEAGTYTFRTTSDDGSRLWVNNTQVVNAWQDQGYVSYSGTVSMTAGQSLPITMEYYDNNYGAAVKLEWQRPGKDYFELIPGQQLSSIQVPAAPSNLHTTQELYNQVDLAWTDNASNETGFQVQRATASDFSGSVMTYDLSGSNQSSYSDTGVTAGTTYYYRVRATNADGSSAWSNTISADPGMQTVYPSDSLSTTSSSNAWGPYEHNLSNGEDQANDGHTITLNGTTYTKGLGVHADASLTYNIASQGYTRFRSDIGVDDEVGTNGSVVFQVWLDSVKVYDSGTMTGTSATQQIDLDVSGKSTLQLVVDDGGSNFADHADWAGARLLRPEAPLTIAIAGNATTNEGSVYTLSITASGSAAATAQLSVNWGGADGTSNAGAGATSATHSYLDGTVSRSIVVTGTVGTNSYSSNALAVSVANVAPSVSISGPSTGNEGSQLTYTSSVSDPAGSYDPISYAWTVSRSQSGFTPQTGNGSSFSFTPPDNGNYTISLNVNDGDGGTANAASVSTAVANVAPQVAITGAPDALTIGTSVNLGCTVTDASSADQAAGFTYAWSVTQGSNSVASGTGSTLSFTPAVAGSYSIQLTVADQDLTPTGSATLSRSTALDAPTNVVVDTNDGLITVRWDAVPNASRYNIYRSTSVGSLGTKINGSTPLVTGTSYTDPGPAQAQTVYYRVKAVDGGGIEGAQSAAAALQPLGLSAPTNLHTDPIPGDSTQLLLSWTDNSDEWQFQVEQKAPDKNFALFATADRNATSVTIPAAVNQDYVYRVRAIKPGAAAYSEELVVPAATGAINAGPLRDLRREGDQLKFTSAVAGSVVVSTHMAVDEPTFQSDGATVGITTFNDLEVNTEYAFDISTFVTESPYNNVWNRWDHVKVALESSQGTLSGYTNSVVIDNSNAIAKPVNLRQAMVLKEGEQRYRLQLSWEFDGSATSFQVCRIINNLFPNPTMWYPPGELTQSGDTYTLMFDPSLETIGLGYSLGDWAVAATGPQSNFSDVIYAADSTVAVPEWFSISPTGGNTLKLLWKNKSNNEVRFEVQKMDDVDKTRWTDVGTASADDPSLEYHDTAAISMVKDYKFHVRAVSSSGASAWVEWKFNGTECSTGTCGSTFLTSNAPGAPTRQGTQTSGGIKENGSFAITSRDMGSASGGLNQSRSFGLASGSTPQAGGTGRGSAVSQLPYLVPSAGGDTVAVVDDAGNARIFERSGTTSTFTARYAISQSMVIDGSSNYVVSDSSGGKLSFWGFTAGAKGGRLNTYTDSSGNVTSASYNGSGVLTSLTHTAATGRVSSFAYQYVSSGGDASVGLQSHVEQRNGSATGGTLVRSVEYGYYSDSDSNGASGDLKTAVIKDASGTAIETKYYRYYAEGEAGGFAHAIKYMFEGDSFARLDAYMISQSKNAYTATDAEVAPYADKYFEYDPWQRVSKVVSKGGGCSGSCAGLGTYTYQYVESGNADGLNSWRHKTIETLNDGTYNITYSNSAGQLMLKVYQDANGQRFGDFYKYDANGQVVLHANPSALDLPASLEDLEQYADLMHLDNGNYQYLDNTDGLIEVSQYYDGSAGTPTGYYEGSALTHGENGLASPVQQDLVTYESHSDGTTNIWVTDTSTVYRNTDGSGAQVTDYGYTWYDNSLQARCISTTLPTVTTDQNGPNSPDISWQYYDSEGRLIWSKDAGGFINHYEFDSATGAMTKQIVDVVYSQLDATAQASFNQTGWSQPSGGLHLVTQYQVDGQGRTTQVTDPEGRVTKTDYDDVHHKVSSYAWNASSSAIIGPVTISRQDLEYGYSERRTETAGGTLLSLSRSYQSVGGQLSYSDQYYDLSGISWSATPNLGSTSNYYRTSYEHEKRARVAKTTSPTGTIAHGFYDGRGNSLSNWVGTDDTPTNSTTNDLTHDGVVDWRDFRKGVMDNGTALAGTNMVKVSENQYDNGGIGDGNLTKTTQFPGGGAADRVTENYYDWRNRQVATKSGVQATESTSDNSHPISYVDYDNLSQVTASYGFDGDGVTITSTGGVPNQPSASLLRSKGTNEYDNQGRVFRTHAFAVNATDGSVSASSLIGDTFFDHRGNVIKTVSAGGLVGKSVYDGAGRLSTSYSTDGGGDSGWADADDVAGDKVLEQSVNTFDGSGNVILTTGYQRNHNTTDTGELSSSDARRSYAAGYFDLAGRTTASVNVGTNGGSAYTRPSTVPNRSDTVLVSSYTYDSAGRVDEVTDPKGKVTKTYYDALSRTTKTIAAYTDGTPTASTNQTTLYGYDGSGHTITMTADLPAGQADQTTEYVYGFGTNSSLIYSNDILTAVKYPDKTTGAASNGEKESFTANRLGQTLTKTDRNGTTHTLGYDVLGRMTSDTITTLGSGVDGTVRKLATAFNTQGLIETISSSNAADVIVNQIKRQYNGLGQMTAEYQENTGTVNGSTPSVAYDYSDLAHGSRLTTVTYPTTSRQLTYNYASGLDDSIGRLSSISDTGGTLESYQYLGLSTVAIRTLGNGVSLTYFDAAATGDAGDHYAGLDRFGRVVDQRWVNSGGTAVDRFGYGYDANSNRLYKENLLDATKSELYGPYDDLNRLSTFDRGTLNGAKDAISGSPSRSQDWTLDALGNWQTLSDNGTQDRTHNAQNQVTAIQGQSTPTYDNNGNTTTDQSGKKFVYDAWNRLVTVNSSSNTLVESFSHDAASRKITETPNGGPTRVLYYSSQWQVLEERQGGVAVAQQVWSPVYVDAMIERDRDSDGNQTLDERLYVMQDANYNVTGLMSTNGAVVERYLYDPYGQASVLDANWATDADGQSDVAWRYLHQGGRYDAASGLYEFRHRAYSPTFGRWMQTDPIRYADGCNLYGFLGGRAVSQVDPSGRQAVDSDMRRWQADADKLLSQYTGALLQYGSAVVKTALADLNQKLKECKAGLAPGQSRIAELHRQIAQLEALLPRYDEWMVPADPAKFDSFEDWQREVDRVRMYWEGRAANTRKAIDSLYDSIDDVDRSMADRKATCEAIEKLIKRYEEEKQMLDTEKKLKQWQDTCNQQQQDLRNLK